MMKYTAPTITLVFCCLLGGCTGWAHPCPGNSRMASSGDGCVPAVDAADAGTPRDASTPADAGTPSDASIPADAGTPLDANTPTDAGTPRDASTLADTGIPLDASTPADAGTPPDAGPQVSMLRDASAEPDGGPTPCSKSDVDAWSTLHTSAGLVFTIHDCRRRLGCSGAACDIAGCLRNAAGLEGCSHCVEREVECVTRACQDDCGPDASDETCLACACAADCVQDFARCADAGRTICDTCEATGGMCGGGTLPPELIMAVIG